jgi:hypothetical protein
MTCPSNPYQPVIGICIYIFQYVIHPTRSVNMSGSSYSVMREGELDELGPVLAQFLPRRLQRCIILGI